MVLISGCQNSIKKTTPKASSGGAYLKFYESEIPLENSSQSFSEGRSQVSTYFFASATNAELLKKKENFKNSFNSIKNCLVDAKAVDRILFYYGDTENPTDCRKSEHRTVGLRLWKLCPQGLYEVTLGPIDVTEGIEIHCTK